MTANSTETKIGQLDLWKTPGIVSIFCILFPAVYIG